MSRHDLNDVLKGGVRHIESMSKRIFELITDLDDGTLKIWICESCECTIIAGQNFNYKEPFKCPFCDEQFYT